MTPGPLREECGEPGDIVAAGKLVLVEIAVVEGDVVGDAEPGDRLLGEGAGSGKVEDGSGQPGIGEDKVH